MYFRKIKFGNTFLVLLILYLFGYTSFFGGPYGLAKVLFIIMLLGAVIFFIFIYFVLNFIKRKTTLKPTNEKIKVDVKIIE